MTVDAAPQPVTQAEWQAEAEALRNDLEVLTESWVDLAALRADDAGWSKFGPGDRQMDKAALLAAARAARIALIANPLLRRGVGLRTAYVWSQGVTIMATATGPTADNPAQQDVNQVVQAWIDDEDVQKVLLGPAAQQRNERTLATDGTFHLALVTDPVTGRVRPRVVPFDEIIRIVANPEDTLDRQYYLREWTETADHPKFKEISRLIKEADRD